MDETSHDVHEQVLHHLKTIPVFDRLTDPELQKIYGICNFKRYMPDEVIYRFGDQSNSLFMLLGGRLVARTKAGIDIAYIPPVGVVGEMEVLTDQPRSADVIALEESIGFEISK